MNKEPPGPTYYRLRKLRKGVTFRFNGYDHDGIPHWLLYDAGRNKFFVIGWPEYEMLSRWPLGDPQSILEAVNSETTLNLEMRDFENLLDFLNRNYLTEQRWRNVYDKAKEQKIIKGENLFYWFIRYYLFFRVPIFHPDKFLNKTRKFGEFLFKRSTLFVMMFLGMVAVYQIGSQWENFTHTFSTIFNWQGFMFYFIAFSIAKCFHEFGHAYMAKLYGVSVPTMGIAFLVFWPVLYTDTTHSWSLPSHQRLRIALAGMWVETYITIIAALIWANVHNVTIQMICYVMVTINWVSTLLINVSPFMRFDGYYVLSDILKTPNLQGRSFALARWQLRNWLFGWEEGLPEHFSKRMHWILVTYAFITWIYRLIIYFGIAILVYHYFFKALGIILFLIELFAFILRPFVVELQTWYDLRHQFTLNRRTFITCTCATIFLIIMCLPINQNINMNATLSYSHEFLHPSQNAILQNTLPLPGTAVKANQVLIELKSPELEENLKTAQLEYDKILAEVRRASFNENFSNDLGTLEAKISEKKTQYDKLVALQQQLIIKAPFDGIISDVAPNVQPGDTVMKNSWLLDIVNPRVLVVEAYADQADITSLNPGDTGFFYPINLEQPKVAVKLFAIEPVNVTELTWSYSKESEHKRNTQESVPVDTPIYHASLLGGKIATNLTDKGKYVPVDSIYRVLLTPEQSSLNLRRVELGTVILTVKPRSYVYRLFYKLKRVFVQESGF